MSSVCGGCYYYYCSHRWPSDFRVHPNHLVVLLKQTAGPHPQRFSGGRYGVGLRMCMPDKFHGDMDAAGQEPHIETHSSLDLCPSMWASSMDITQELSRTAAPRTPWFSSVCSRHTRFLLTWRFEKHGPAVRCFLVIVPVESVISNALFLSSFTYSFDFPDSVFSWFSSCLFDQSFSLWFFCLHTKILPQVLFFFCAHFACLYWLRLDSTASKNNAPPQKPNHGLDKLQGHFLLLSTSRMWVP